MTLTMGSVIRDLEIIRMIGEGGMSEVYLVQDNLDRQFALKTLSANLSRDSSFRERFKQEAKIMSTLHHPNIVQLHSYFEEEDMFCLVMEYVEGGSLKDLIRDIGPIPEERALNIFTQMAEALSYAHDKGVIHRDIKPSNIMIGKDNEVKVMDFGIARMAESPGLTRTGTQMGTLVYMSPEQIRDSKHIDSKSDVYSLGVTLYEMLTGQAPYDENTDSDFDIRVNIVNKDLPDPTLTYPHISDKILRLLRSMTQKDKMNRPDTNQLLIVEDDQSPSIPNDVSPSASEPASLDTSVQTNLPYPMRSERSNALGWIFGIIVVVVGVLFSLSLCKPKTEVPVMFEAAVEEEAAVEDVRVESGFEDNFEDNRNNWQHGINDAGFERSITGGHYVLSNHSGSQSWSTGITLPIFDFNRNWKLSVRFGNRYNTFTDSPSNDANNFIFFAGDNSTWESPKYRFHRYSSTYGHAAFCTIQNLATGEGMTLYDDTEMNEPEYLVYNIEKRGERLYFYYDGTPFYYQAEQDYFPFSGSYGNSIGFGVYQNSKMIIDYIRLEYM